jgi:hypothetical protein
MKAQDARSEVERARARRNGVSQLHTMRSLDAYDARIVRQFVKRMR